MAGPLELNGVTDESFIRATNGPKYLTLTKDYPHKFAATPALSSLKDGGLSILNMLEQLGALAW